MAVYESLNQHISCFPARDNHSIQLILPGKNTGNCSGSKGRAAGQEPVLQINQIKNELTEQKLKNVVGVIPGKSKKDEYVVFAGHYDHLGIGKPDAKGDSIYNGANDDAAGTTAVMMLAKYFSEQKNNERTLIFVAFTAEEIGGYGSRYFSKQLNPDKVMAMFNIEMIGTDSKWGTNSAYITGYEKSASSIK